MKFCSFSYNESNSYGVEGADGTVIDLKSALGPEAPQTLELFIEAAVVDAGLMSKARDIAASEGGLDPETVTWLPLLRRPGKIMGVAINNKIGQAVAHRPFENPAFFFKPSSSLIGNKQEIVVNESYGVTHPEPELAVIIGRGGKNISEKDALSHVFGYSIMDDVTSPGLKEHDSIECIVPKAAASSKYTKLTTWRNVPDADSARSLYLTYHARSKGTDTFAVLGPWLVTSDDIANPNELTINSYSGDELAFEDSTANLVFSVERIISHASHYFTLEPGDVLHCGTAMRPPEGGRFPDLSAWNLYKDSADVKVVIEGVGVQVSPIKTVSGE